MFVIWTNSFCSRLEDRDAPPEAYWVVSFFPKDDNLGVLMSTVYPWTCVGVPVRAQAGWGWV